MKKAEAPALIKTSWNGSGSTISIDVVSTFEMPNPADRKVNGSGRYALSGYDGESHRCSSMLNRWSCLMLQHRGVPQSFFTVKMKADLERAIQMVKDMNAAQYILHKCSAAKDHYSSAKTADLHMKIEHQSLQPTFYTDKSKIKKNKFRISSTVTDDDDGGEDDDIVAGLDITEHLEGFRDRRQVEKATEFLRAGHDLAEPMFQQLLRRLQALEFGKLKECKIRINDSAFLPGVPDPTNTLKEGEICVVLPVGTALMQTAEQASELLFGQTTDTRTNLGVSVDDTLNTVAVQDSMVDGPVVLMRFPLLHIGEIRLLTSVLPTPELLKTIVGTSGGCIYFSTQGRRSAADEMGGGDFDGDLYCVFFGTSGDHAIVPYIQNQIKATGPVAAPVPEMEDQLVIYLEHSKHINKASGSNMTHMTRSKAGKSEDSNEFLRLKGILFIFDDHDLVCLALICVSFVDSYRNKAKLELGLYSLALEGYLDSPKYGPTSVPAVQCYRIANRAMDAAKSGKELLSLKRLLDNAPIPHYSRKRNEKQKQSTYRSTSVVGVLYDMVLDAELELERMPISISLDPDLQYDSLLNNSDLHFTWQGHLLQYKAAIAILLANIEKPGLSKSTSDSDKIVDLQVKAIVISTAGMQNRLEDLKQHYRIIFDEEARKLFETAVSEIYHDTVASIQEKAAGSQWRGLIDRQLETLRWDCRKIVAAAIYTVTYNHAKSIQNSSNNSYNKSPISFCWELCPFDLHHIKATAVAKRAGRYPLELV